MSAIVRKVILVGSLLCGLWSVVLSPAFSSPLNLSPVETQDVQAYAAIENLIALGLIDKVVEGQKPWPRNEVARMIEEAKANIDRLENVHEKVRAKEQLKWLSKQFTKEIGKVSEVKIHPLKRGGAEYLFLDSASRLVPRRVGNSGDEIDAFINPLIAYRKGRNVADSHNFGIDTRHEIDLTKYFAVTGTPNFLVRKRSDASTYVRIGFDELYGRTEFANIGIQMGRDVLAWGQAPEGGVIFSTNATPLDQFRIGNVHPFRLPWVFKYLGNTQAGFFFAVEGADRDHPHPYLTGMKLSFQLVRNFEIGFTTALISGGEGGKRASFGKRVADVFGFAAALVNQDPNISDRVGGFDFRVRIPPLRGLEFYYELMFEDTQSISHWDLMFVDYAIHQFGFFLPRLNREGSQTLRLEGQYSGFRSYRHHQYTSGWTNNRRILGSELGPEGLGLRLVFDSRPTNVFHQTHEFAVENRGSDVYQMSNNATRLIVIQKNPSETRYRWMSAFGFRHNPKLEWVLQAGYERVRQFDFTIGDDRNNFLAGLKLNFYPE